jgi:hypothetical protein
MRSCASFCDDALFPQFDAAAQEIIRKAEGAPDGEASIASLWPSVDPALLRMVGRMVDWDLRRVPSAAQLLKDPFFHDVRGSMDRSSKTRVVRTMTCAAFVCVCVCS